jgi:hypothetical protein
MLPADENLLRYLDQITGSSSSPDIRKGEEETAPSRPIVRYMLAFEQPHNLAPTPIFHRSVLGRGGGADIHLAHDDYLSCRHCRFGITCDNATGDYVLYIEDLGSTNGTFVDGSRLEEHRPARLKHGSRIQVGRTRGVIVHVPY